MQQVPQADDHAMSFGREQEAAAAAEGSSSSSSGNSATHKAAAGGSTSKARTSSSKAGPRKANSAAAAAVMSLAATTSAAALPAAETAADYVLDDDDNDEGGSINNDNDNDNEDDSTTATSFAKKSSNKTNNNNNHHQQMTKEEAALADRRRRNRETQRAIRKKKAARLQDAEVRASAYESEIESLKSNLRKVELEKIELQRELEDWKAGRITFGQLQLQDNAAAATAGGVGAGIGANIGAGGASTASMQERYIPHRHPPHPRRHPDLHPHAAHPHSHPILPHAPSHPPDVDMDYYSQPAYDERGYAHPSHHHTQSHTAPYPRYTTYPRHRPLRASSSAQSQSQTQTSSSFNDMHSYAEHDGVPDQQYQPRHYSHYDPPSALTGAPPPPTQSQPQSQSQAGRGQAPHIMSISRSSSQHTHHEQSSHYNTGGGNTTGLRESSQHSLQQPQHSDRLSSSSSAAGAAAAVTAGVPSTSTTPITAAAVILGKRKSVDQHSPNLPPPSPHATTALGSPRPDIAVRSPSVVSSATASRFGNIGPVAADDSDRVHAQTPSVFQPITSDSAPVEHASPTSYSEDLPDGRASFHKEGVVDGNHLSALDTSNEEGSGGSNSNPSPSSAGTIRPGYSHAFGRVTTALGDAVAAARLRHEQQEPRSNSLASTTTATTSTSASASDGGAEDDDYYPTGRYSGSKGRTSYDDYHDFWTSSTSRSQSDSHTSSLSSYSRSGHFTTGKIGGGVAGVGGGTSALHAVTYPNNADIIEDDKDGISANAAAIADGMILSMSRQSLCASPVSIAHLSPRQDGEEGGATGFINDQSPSSSTQVAAAAATLLRNGRRIASSSPFQHATRIPPSLPSLSASLESVAHPDRTVSLPPLSSAISTVVFPQSAQQLPSSNNHTLPPIPSVLLGTTHQSHPGLSATAAAAAAIAPAYASKTLLATRNGRGKSTSYPFAGNETIFEGQEASYRAPGEQKQDIHHSRRASEAHEFQWPSNVHERYHGHKVDPTMLIDSRTVSNARPIARPPISSTRDHSIHDPASFEVTQSPDAMQTVEVLRKDEGFVSAEPVDRQVDDGTVVMGVPRGEAAGATSRGKPQRRKSTYEDFVGIFGAHSAPLA